MCGIFGTINAKKPKKFRYTGFASLGIINDARGGDSCGIFIDGRYEYGVTDKKLFKNFMLESKLLEETRGKEVSVAIGHCRKASVGSVSEANAQPVIIKDEEGKPVFVLAHNGTIKNWEELAKKYIPGVNTTGMTDSQVMARIFYTSGYNVLSEYYGGSVFFIVDYRGGSPKCLFFQGYSKNSEYSKEESMERPFYFAYRDGSLVFSSIYEMLQATCPGSTLYQPAKNTLYSFSEKSLIAEREYPRDKVTQTMPYTRATTYTPPVTTHTQSSVASQINKEKQSTSGTTGATNTTGTSQSTGGTGTQQSPFRPNVGSGAGTRTPGTSFGKKITLPTIPRDQKATNQEYKNQRLVYDYQTSRYKVAGNNLHGVFALSSYGVILDVDDENTTLTSHIIWFFDGIPLNLEKGEYMYARLRALCQDFKMSASTFANKFPDVVRWYSADRIYRDRMTNLILVSTSPKDHKLFSGTFMRLCDVYGAHFEQGIEVDHNLMTPKGGPNASFLENVNQGGNRISTEVNISKSLKRICQEIARKEA